VLHLMLDISVTSVRNGMDSNCSISRGMQA
jgi:hypothetical protein